MKKPLTVTHKVLTPAQRERRRAARKAGLKLMQNLLAEPSMQDRETAIEAARFIVRALTDVIEQRGSIARAQGILAGAQATLAQDDEASPGSARDRAEKAFKGVDK